jgi:oxygen-independent coproporphyrinogen-3 oxidase
MKCGVYVHIPFCDTRCAYCSFYSNPLKDTGFADAGLYISRLSDEFERRLPELAGEFTADTIYFGGGTPSLMGHEKIGGLIDSIKSLITVERDAEVTVEINPAQFIDTEISGLISAGVNRLVLGVQSFDPDYRRCIGRAGPPADRDEINLFKSLSRHKRALDLISGWQSEVTLDDCRRAVDMEPGHISLYMLTFDEGAKLYSMMKQDEYIEQGLIEAFESGALFLKDKGYSHYEISNFCRPGMESRHNMKYWRFEPYIGFGPSAHSFIKGGRSFNKPDLALYISSPGKVRTPDPRSPGQAAAEYIMTAIRLTDGFTSSEMERAAGAGILPASADEICRLIDEGFLEPLWPDTVRLTWKGIMFSDRVVYRIVENFI